MVMTKRFFFYLCYTLVFIGTLKSQIAKNKFILYGRISGMTKGHIYIHYRSINGDGLVDSAEVKQGYFQFNGCISEPTRVAITKVNPKLKNYDKKGYTQIFIEPTIMHIKIADNKFDELVLIGSKTQNELNVFRKMQQPASEPSERIMSQYNYLNKNYIKQKKEGASTDSLKIIVDKMDSLSKEMEKYNSASIEISKKFYDRFPNSYVTLYDLKNNLLEFTYDELNRYYNRISNDNVKNSFAGQELKKGIEKLVTVIPGKKAPLFSAMEMKGDTLKLSDYLGKYVLLDFWATWCRPCREESPTLISLYNKYKDKGIEFIGIASDDDRVNEWKEAVSKDGTGIWKHILSGASMKKRNSINQLYFTPMLPVIFLINSDGVVIGRFDGSDEIDRNLTKQLEKIFETK